MDELDFWVATFALVILALFEIVIFFWIFGADKAWEEINRGAEIRVPRVFYYLMKYVTPVFLFVILVAWCYEQLPSVLSKGDTGVWAARIFLVVLFIIHLLLVRVAWKRRARR